jgi:hypothetical protein
MSDILLQAVSNPLLETGEFELQIFEKDKW